MGVEVIAEQIDRASAGPTGGCRSGVGQALGPLDPHVDAAREQLPHLVGETHPERLADGDAQVGVAGGAGQGAEIIEAADQVV